MSEQDDNRLYIRIYADDEPSRKAEKLYQICGETESQEVAQWLKEYFPSADRPTGEWVDDCTCSICHWMHEDNNGFALITKYNYCPNCGARMVPRKWV